jgi:hypothetical protein
MVARYATGHRQSINQEKKSGSSAIKRPEIIENIFSPNDDNKFAKKKKKLLFDFHTNCRSMI